MAAVHEQQGGGGCRHPFLAEPGHGTGQAYGCGDTIIALVRPQAGRNFVQSGKLSHLSFLADCIGAGNLNTISRIFSTPLR